MSGQRGGTLRHLIRSPRGAFALAVLALLAITALVSLFWLPANPNQSNISEAWQSPSLTHWLGTDSSGRDIASRLMAGARVTVLVVLGAAIVSGLIGLGLAIISALGPRKLREPLIIFIDVLIAFPTLLLAIVVAIAISGGQSDLRSGIIAAAASITVVFIPQYFRVVRAEVVRVKSEAFVESAKVIGASTPRVMFRHVLRNSTRTLPLIVTLNASEAISTLAALGFLGFGIQPTAAAEWGYDLNKSISDVAAGIWWTAIPPGVAIVLTILGITLIGESLNDLADPRLRARRRSKASQTPADAVASHQPTAQEFMGEVP